MPLVLRCIVLLSVLLLAGCSGRMARWGGPDPRAAEAQALVNAGDYAEALEIYRRLIATSGDPNTYRARAADTALRAGDSGAARQYASAVDVNDLEAADRNLFDLLRARLDLNSGRAKDAMSKLNSLSPAKLDESQVINYHTLRASAFNQLGDMIASAKERLTLAPKLKQADAIDKNNEGIYDALSRLPSGALQKSAPPPDVLGGWISLTRTVRKTPPAKLSLALGEWSQQWPSHPANGAFVQGLIVNAGPQAKAPQPKAKPRDADVAPAATPTPPTGPFIGVLLPLSGALTDAGQAVRTGLVAAYYADPSANKLPLRFVDSETGDIAGLYRHVVEQGGRSVIGPLVKEKIAALTKGATLSIPVLGLNQVPGVEMSQLYQFGLNPEDEVEQAAGSAWFDGRQNAWVLAPSTPFGQRMVSHFSQYWKQFGGKIAAIKTYAHHGDNNESVVKDLIAKANPPATAGSPVANADFVLLIADNRDAKVLAPLLAYADGSRIPAYSTSHVYNGNPAMQASSPELNGIIFCDIPWLLNPDAGQSLSARSLSAQIGQVPGEYVKLIALGLDAYRMLGELGNFQTSSQYRFDGATGSLSLKTGNRIQRQLECAQFEDGLPRQRGLAPLLEKGPPAATTP